MHTKVTFMISLGMISRLSEPIDNFLVVSCMMLLVLDDFNSSYASAD